MESGIFIVIGSLQSSTCNTLKCTHSIVPRFSGSFDELYDFTLKNLPPIFQTVDNFPSSVAATEMCLKRAD